MATTINNYTKMAMALFRSWTRRPLLLTQVLWEWRRRSPIAAKYVASATRIWMGSNITSHTLHHATQTFNSLAATSILGASCRAKTSTLLVLGCPALERKDCFNFYFAVSGNRLLNFDYPPPIWPSLDDFLTLFQDLPCSAREICLTTWCILRVHKSCENSLLQAHRHCLPRAASASLHLTSLNWRTRLVQWLLLGCARCRKAIYGTITPQLAETVTSRHLTIATWSLLAVASFWNLNRNGFSAWFTGRGKSLGLFFSFFFSPSFLSISVLFYFSSVFCFIFLPSHRLGVRCFSYFVFRLVSGLEKEKNWDWSAWLFFFFFLFLFFLLFSFVK